MYQVAEMSDPTPRSPAEIADNLERFQGYFGRVPPPASLIEEAIAALRSAAPKIERCDRCGDVLRSPEWNLSECPTPTCVEARTADKFNAALGTIEAHFGGRLP